MDREWPRRQTPRKHGWWETPTAAERALMNPTEQRMDEELRVYRLYLDLARFERGERP